MTTYELRVHSYDFTIDKHTGYDLITYHEDNTVTIESIDVNPYKNGMISLYMSFDYKKSNAIKINYMHDEIVSEQEIYCDESESAESLNSIHYAVKTIPISSEEAFTIFNKIKLETLIMNQFSENIEYELLGRNCNSSTQYFANKYLPEQDVFSGLPEDNYFGKNNDFIDGNEYIQKASDLTEAIYNGMPDGFDINNINIEKLENGELFISDGTQGYETRYYPAAATISNSNDGTFIFTGNVSTEIYNSGNNCIIKSLAGNDIITLASKNNTVKRRRWISKPYAISFLYLSYSSVY